MRLLHLYNRPLLVTLLILVNIASSFAADLDRQLSIAFRHIRNDGIPHNAKVVSAWIYSNRQHITRELLDELYKTDRQGRDVILFALMETEGFRPDDRFRRTLVARLNDEDHVVGNHDLDLRVHWRAFRYINVNYASFRQLLLDNLHRTDDMWCIWGTISLLDRHNDLEKEFPKFGKHTWEVISLSLRDDDISYNAGQAVRVFLIIGQPTLPILKELAKSKEEQTGDYASAMIDAMNGSQRAYGYLASQVGIEMDILRRPIPSPDWLKDEAEKWHDHDYGPKRKRYR